MKKNRRKHRWIRIVFIYIPVGLILLFLGFLFVLRWFFPNEQARQFLIAQLQTATQKHVSIDEVKLNPFGSLDFEGIVIGEKDIDIKTGDFYIQSEAIRVYYHLAYLLKRQFRIAGVQIESPQIIFSAMPSASDSTLLEEKAMTFADSTAAVMPLPLSFNMRKFSLKNLSFTFIQPDSLSNIRASISGLNVELSDLNVPRNILASPEKVEGHLILSVDDGDIQFSQNEMVYSLIPDVNLDILNHIQSGWSVQGQLQFASASQDHVKLGARMAITGTGLGDTIDIKNLDVFLNENRFLQCLGKIRNVTTSPEFNVVFQSDGIDIESVVASARQILPEALLSNFTQFYAGGNLKPAHGQFKGNLSQASLDYQLSLENGRFILLNPPVEVQNINLNLSAKGSGAIDKLVNGDLNTEVKIDKFMMHMPDSTSLSVQDVEFSAKAMMDSLIWPKQITLSGSILNVLDGSLNLRFHLDRLHSANNLFPYKTEGYILVDSLAVQSIPAMVEGLSGKVNLITHFKSRSTDPVTLHLSAVSPQIIYPMGETQDTTGQIMLSSSFYLGGNLKSMSWQADSVDIKLNDVIQMKCSGQVDTVGYQGHVDELIIYNEPLMRMLPKSIQKNIEGLSVHGKERLKAFFRGYLKDDIPPWFKAVLMMDQVQTRWASMGFSLENLTGSVEVSGTPYQLENHGSLSLQGVCFKDWRQACIETLNVELSGLAMIPDYTITDEISFSSNDLGLNAFCRFEASHLNDHPDMRFNSKLSFYTSDTIEVAEQLYATGDLICFLHGLASNPQKQHYEIYGNINSDGLDLNHPIFKLSGLYGSFPFQVDADLEHFRLIQPKILHIYKTLDYARWRSFYKNKFPTLKTIYIDAIDARGFRAEDIEMDIDISQGLVQVPYFNINLFEGNLGGAFHINLGTGNPDSIAYTFNAQAAKLNSAAIGKSPAQVQGTSELNATLSLNGFGLNIKKGIDVDGYFHITKIGPQFASTLLRQMNPDGKDRGMTMTRRLLDTGWKPNGFVFDIRHGYVYPSLSLSQPWFSPVRIPGELEYGRIPIEFFFQNANSQ